MREDTKEIAKLMDEAADLIEQANLETKPALKSITLDTGQKLLAKISKLLTKWVESHLSP